MSYRTPEYHRIRDEGDQAHDEMKAVLDEHLPRETVSIVLGKVDAICCNHFEQGDHDCLRVYRALMGLIPEHHQEIRAAFQPVVFDGSRCDEADWRKWERGIQWPITPDYYDLLMKDVDGAEPPIGTEH